MLQGNCSNQWHASSIVEQADSWKMKSPLENLIQSQLLAKLGSPSTKNSEEGSKILPIQMFEA